MNQESENKAFGFTLVELLIVVAVIGVLATLGVPTFKRLIQKASKTEAKVALAGIYAVEQAFYSEYGSYGSNLVQMGFEVDGMQTYFNGNRWWSKQPGTYSLGFPVNGLCPLVRSPAYPWGSLVGPWTAINLGLASFYNASFETGQVIFGRGVDDTVPGACSPSAFSMDGSSFVATASGVIAPGVDIGTTNMSLVDQWSITDQRALQNVNDGVQ